MARSHHPRKHGEVQPQRTSGAGDTGNSQTQPAQTPRQQQDIDSTGDITAEHTTTANATSTRRVKIAARNGHSNYPSIEELGAPESQLKKKADAPPNRFVLTPASQRNRSAKERAGFAAANSNSSRIGHKSAENTDIHGKKAVESNRDKRQLDEVRQKSRQQNQLKTSKLRAPQRVKDGLFASNRSSTPPRAFPFLDLPLELAYEVISLLPERDIRRFRQSCKHFEALLQFSVPHIAKQAENCEKKRLQSDVDEPASLDPPTDLHSTMRALHVWTKRRGTFSQDYENCNRLSITRLSAILYKGKVRRDELWEALKSGAEKLWIVLMAFTEPAQIPLPDFQRDMKDYFGAAGAQALISYVENPESIDPSHRICGPVHNAHELALWPNSILTPWIPYPVTPARLEPDRNRPFENFMTWLKDDYHSEILLSKPDLKHKDLPQFLGLPTLPSPILFFYVSFTEVGYTRVRKLIRILKNPERDPKGINKFLLKIAILREVKML